MFKNYAAVVEFPSPCGVSFILIGDDLYVNNEWNGKFPSPYGVSFILIYSS